MDAAILKAVRIRYIARCQIGTLHLHQDLCLKVLEDYRRESDSGVNDDVVWPYPGQEHYALSALPRVIEKILDLTEKQDAIIAADVIGDAIDTAQDRETYD